MLDLSLPDIQALKPRCEKIIAEAGNGFTWSWDGRFEAMLSQFEAGQASTLHPVLTQEISKPWTVETMDQAPPVVVEIAKYLYGPRPTQELFVTDTSKPPCLVAAWWPWQGGGRISVRILLWVDVLDKSGLIEEFRGWFGI